MKLSNLIVLGGAIAGAAYLKDKTRRDRVMGQARGFIDNVKSRATELAGEVQSKGREALGSLSQRSKDLGAQGADSSFGAESSSFGSESSFGTSGYGSSTYR